MKSVPMLQLCLIFCLGLILPVSGAIRQHMPDDDIKFLKMIARLDEARFSIKAKISYGDEDEEEMPLAGKSYLLDESIIGILKEANFTPTVEGRQSLTEEDYLEALTGLLLEPDQGDRKDEDALLTLLLWEKIKAHQVSLIETDYFGRGRSGIMKAGNYYLFACEPVGDETFVWNYPVFLSGTMTVEMDQYNTAAVFTLR